MRAVDTNVIVRLIVRDDPQQTAAAERLVEKGAWVSTPALAEAVWALDSVYGLAPSELARMIEMLVRHRDLVIEDSATVTQALTLFRTRPALGFPDCLMLELARKAGHVPLGTFDRSLGKIGGAQRI